MPVRMAAIQKSTSSKCWRGSGKKGILLHCWWECTLVQPLQRTMWRFLENLELELPYDPAIPLLGIHTKETRIERDTCTPMFIAALFRIARTWKQPRCPSTDEWIRKLWYIYTMEYYSAIKKSHVHGLYRLLCPWDSPDKNTGVSSRSLLQGIFQTHGLNSGLPHSRQILYQLSHWGSRENGIEVP